MIRTLLASTIGKRLFRSVWSVGLAEGFILGNMITRNTIVETLNADAVLTATMDAKTLQIVIEIVQAATPPFEIEVPVE